MEESFNKLKTPKEAETFIGLRIHKRLVELVDSDRELSRIPRSAWVTQAIIEKLERAGYELK